MGKRQNCLFKEKKKRELKRLLILTELMRMRERERAKKRQLSPKDAIS